jgi:hypothetical protein
MINAKLQNIIDTKSAIGNAIVNKGGTITGETPFFNYAAQIDGISTGTPQTIFTASDGSKWALTNAVNLVNDAGNVTHDFNYWQPANNSTSDPILNVGTVNGNISGNIRIVQVNQVNIAQYGNIVATDTSGGKYIGYNGYDSITNPSPTGNATFNRWLLNNSATGTVIFANATFTTGTFNGSNVVLNQSVMTESASASYGGQVLDSKIKDGHIFIGGQKSTFSNQTIEKRLESNLGFIGATANFGGAIRAFALNNGFIYAAGTSGNGIQKFYEGNLVRVANSGSIGGDQIEALVVNNGFVYVAGDQRLIQKFHEGNLVRSTNSPTYNSTIYSLAVNNSFVYAGGLGDNFVPPRIIRYHESNLGVINNVAFDTFGTSGAGVYDMFIENGFIYAAGGGDAFRGFKKYVESNFALDSNSPSGDVWGKSIVVGGDFVYGSGNFSTSVTISKYHKSNMVFLANSSAFNSSTPNISALSFNNTFLYAGGSGFNGVKKYSTFSIGTFDNQTFYTATKIKE